MRVADGRMHRSMTRMIGAARARVDVLQRQAATGKRLALPSDDPAGTTQAQALRSLLEDSRLFQRNVDDALHWTAATEQPLQTVVELLTKLKETALRGGDDATEDRATLAKSVDDLLQEMVAQANATLDDRYLFAGFDDRTPPYATGVQVAGETFRAGAADGAIDLANARLVASSVVITDAAGQASFTEGVDYRVDYASGRVTPLAGGGLVAGQDYRASYATETTSSVQPSGPLRGDVVRHIGRERTQTVNLVGPEVFTAGSDFFQLAIDLKNALWKDDTSRVRTLAASLDTALAHATSLLGLAGSRTAALESQQAWLEVDEKSLQEHLSRVEDADMAEVLMNLQVQQTVYQAALAATARVMQVSLVNFL